MGKSHQTHGKKKTRAADKLIQEDNLECICPYGCVVKTMIDPKHLPADAVLLSCTNDEKNLCGRNRYIHGECLKKWENHLVKLLATNSIRGSRWTDTQRWNNLWNKKGYECTMNQCRCPCSGFLRRESDIETATLVPKETKVPKKVTKPKLETYTAENQLKMKNLDASSFFDNLHQFEVSNESYEKPAPPRQQGAVFGVSWDEDSCLPTVPLSRHETSENRYTNKVPKIGAYDEFPLLGHDAQNAISNETVWNSSHNAYISTSLELKSSLEVLLIKCPNNVLMATNNSLLHLMHRLDANLHQSIADEGGLLSWINKCGDSLGLYAVKDAIMTVRTAKNLGHLASSVSCQNSAHSDKSLSKTPCSSIGLSHPPVSIYPGPFPHPICSKSPPAAPASAPAPASFYNLDRHIQINTDVAYDSLYADAGMALVNMIENLKFTADK